MISGKFKKVPILLHRPAKVFHLLSRYDERNAASGSRSPNRKQG
jgi:hypothetical protein